MNEKNNGGPAFPVPGLQHDEDFNGMTLRDYFAAKALVGLIAEPLDGVSTAVVVNLTPDPECDREWKPGERFAVASYILADAMLRARDA